MITDTMYIGSGDITALLSDIHSSSYAKLLQRFVSGEKPHYNALDRKSTRLNSSHKTESRMPSSA